MRKPRRPAVPFIPFSSTRLVVSGSPGPGDWCGQPTDNRDSGNFRNLNEETVSEYAEALTDGAKFPPVAVFFDGSDYWLADGFHRYYAHLRIGVLSIEADVRNGTRRDAILHSVGVNAAHGLRRTNADKRKAVETLLNDEEWAKWSDNQIARACGVSVPFVGSVRRPEVAAKQSENRKSSASKNNNHTDNKAVIGLQNESNFVVGLQNQANVIPAAPKFLGTDRLQTGYI